MFKNKTERVISNPVTTYQPKSDIYSARFAREHALNKAISWYLPIQLATLLLFYTGIRYGVLVLSDALYTIGVSLIVSVVMYSRSLSVFTDEARDIMWEIETKARELTQSEEVKSVQSVPFDSSQKTLFKRDTKGSAVIVISGMSLSQTQVSNICETALNTGTVTVNFLESVGLSRQQAESFRAQLARHNLIEFDGGGRVKLTKDGEKMFNANK